MDEEVQAAYEALCDDDLWEEAFDRAVEIVHRRTNGSNGAMAYVSTKCQGSATGPYHHEDCVTGPSPFTAGEKEWCACPCHNEMRQAITGLLNAGWTPVQIRRMYLATREWR